MPVSKPYPGSFENKNESKFFNFNSPLQDLNEFRRSS